MVREGSQPKASQNSGRSTSSGTLFVVGVPIGHHDDITVRALHILKHVDIIASEDASATHALLTHHHIVGTITSYGPQDIGEKIALLLERLRRGKDVALVSDCGMPVIYDPGCRLINAAHRAGILVRSIPGPSVLTAALSISGQSGDAIHFVGHLSARRLVADLQALRKQRDTIVLFVERHALAQTLGALEQVFARRQMTLAVDVTKPHEMTLQGTAGTLLTRLQCVPDDAATTIIIEGRRRSGAR
jgi:16S rRNA (cytidine1402-2'-O)-methyltransferase